MLTQAKVTTMLPVVDMHRARAFYEGKLGFRPDGGPRGACTTVTRACRVVERHPGIVVPGKLVVAQPNPGQDAFNSPRAGTGSCLRCP